MLNVSILVEVFPFIQLQDFLEKLLGKNAKMQIFVPFLTALQCNSCKAQHFSRHAYVLAEL